MEVLYVKVSKTIKPKDKNIIQDLSDRMRIRSFVKMIIEFKDNVICDCIKCNNKNVRKSI